MGWGGGTKCFHPLKAGCKKSYPVLTGGWTVTQNHSRWVLLRHPRPNARDTNMLVSFALGDANISRHPTRVSGI